jgi:hypothetical protein
MRAVTINLTAVIAIGLLAGLSAAQAKERRSPAFSVAVTLSDAAAKRLSSSGEQITVSAMLGGEAKPGVETEDGTIALGDMRREANAKGIASFGPVRLAPSELRKIAGPPRLLINVFTSRRVFENNLLNCGIFDGPFEEIPERPIAIACKLIEE